MADFEPLTYEDLFARLRDRVRQQDEQWEAESIPLKVTRRPPRFDGPPPQDDRTMVQCCPRCRQPIIAVLGAPDGGRVAVCSMGTGCGWQGPVEKLRLLPLWWLKFKSEQR